MCALGVLNLPCIKPCCTQMLYVPRRGAVSSMYRRGRCPGHSAFSRDWDADSDAQRQAGSDSRNDMSGDLDVALEPGSASGCGPQSPA